MDEQDYRDRIEDLLDRIRELRAENRENVRELREENRRLRDELESANFRIRQELEPRIAQEKRAYDAYVLSPGREDRTYTVTELCPHCDNEIEMTWNTDELGYKAFCPVCGKRLMLCDECRHTEGVGGCDYDTQTDTCRFSRCGEADIESDEESCGNGKKRPHRVVIVVEGGSVSCVFGTSDKIDVEIIDRDSDDAGQKEQNENAMCGVNLRSETGKLFQLV